MLAIPALWHRAMPDGVQVFPVMILNTFMLTGAGSGGPLGTGFRAHVADSSGVIHDVVTRELQVVGSAWSGAIAEAHAVNSAPGATA